MASRKPRTLTAKPDDVATLKDWVSRWPKYQNLGFDPETRAPAIYTTDESRTLVSTLKWVREGDAVTILTQPTLFSQQAVDAARQRYTRIQTEKEQYVTTQNAELRDQEQRLLEAWRSYTAASATEKAIHRRTILTLEASIRALEEGIAAKIYEGRVAIYVPSVKRLEAVTQDVPVIPLQRRAITITEAAGGASE